MNFQVNKIDPQWALSNKVILFTNVVIETPYIKIVSNDNFLITTYEIKKSDTNVIKMNSEHRSFLYVSLNESVTIEPYETSRQDRLTEISFDILNRNKPYNGCADIDKLILRNFKDHYFHRFLRIPFDYQGTTLTIKVVGSDKSYGVLTDKTKINPSKPLPTRQSLELNFDFESLGIGGLNEQFSKIFRRAFITRTYDPETIAKMGIKHIKGLLLYGPPGTGKTLIARKIAGLMKSRKPKIINGPEIFNKYVGESERQIRDLFSEARTEYEQKGAASELHVIIFDEIDAIGRSHTGVVNRLLTMMDGVESLDNILVIGMTNRLDLIDDALLRPGRFEVQVEISLPDETGRLSILQIHTARMNHNKMLDAQVDLQKVSALTKNYTGAELEAIVNSASSYALNRVSKYSSKHKNKSNTEPIVTQDDFLLALEEVKPSFGSDQTEIKKLIKDSIIFFTASLKTNYIYVNRVIKSVLSGNNLVNILISGQNGSGKTAMAAQLAIESNFPCIRYISSFELMGLSELSKINKLQKIFHDSYKSTHSLIIIDDLERIIDYNEIGPRFSNSIVQALLDLTSKTQSSNMAIICTTSRSDMLKQMTFNFTYEYELPLVKTNQEINMIIQELAIDMKQAILPAIPLGLPIKKLLTLARID